MFKYLVMVFMTTILAACLGCSKNHVALDPLDVWGSKQSSAQEKSNAVAKLFTNGSPYQLIVLTLGQPDFVFRRSGYFDEVASKGQSSVMSNVLRPGKYILEDLAYGGSDGKMVCLRFDVAGFETNVYERPLLDVFVVNSNAFTNLRAH